MSDVRRATDEDLPGIAKSLGRAFEDDPVAIWAYPPRKLVHGIHRWHELRVAQLIRHGEVWTTDDRAGAACWLPPDRWHGSARELFELYPLLPIVGRRLPRILRGFARVEKAHPQKPPHWYLAILGTDPSRQGEGIGSRTLAPVLEECDRDEVAAYLESSKERNLAFYARHGFRVVSEIDMPSGPRLWGMWRDPRP